jgi:hypothetical protein
VEEGARYFAALDALCAEDLQVHILVIKVINLVTPLSALNMNWLRSGVPGKFRKCQALMSIKPYSC